MQKCRRLGIGVSDFRKLREDGLFSYTKSLSSRRSLTIERRYRCSPIPVLGRSWTFLCSAIFSSDAGRIGKRVYSKALEAGGFTDVIKLVVVSDGKKVWVREMEDEGQMA